MKWNFWVLLMVLLICGCGRSALFEQTALQLKPGMNKSEVKLLFADFRLIVESNKVSKINWATKWYNTNNESTSWLLYGPKQEFVPTFESCIIYFDTNDIILAQYYTPPGHRTPDARPPSAP